MKKFLFFLLFASAVSVNAQSFDETDLIGTWNTNGLAYAPYKITNIESITLGDCLYDYGKGLQTMCGFITNTTMTEYDSHEGEHTVTRDWRAVTDFFISNNNKLHIVQNDNFTLHFIIEELSATTLKVKTFDGQSYTFAKDNSLSAISVNQTSSADASTYNLSGQKVENVTVDGIYIQNGQKKVIKK